MTQYIVFFTEQGLPLELIERGGQAGTLKISGRATIFNSMAEASRVVRASRLTGRVSIFSVKGVSSPGKLSSDSPLWKLVHPSKRDAAIAKYAAK